MLYERVQRKIQACKKRRRNMPTIDTEKIRNAAIYMDGEPIIELQEMDIAEEKFIDKLSKRSFHNREEKRIEGNFDILNHDRW